MSLSHRVLPVLVLSLLAVPARATEYCVQTLSDLTAGLALATLAEQPDDTVTLRLVAQTYAWSGAGGGGATIFNSKNRLNLLGGYNADCTARTVDAENTVLDGLSQLALALSTRGDGITVEGIRFQNLNLALENRTSCSDYGERFVFRRNIVLPRDYFGVSVDCQDVRLENNLVIGGTDRYLQHHGESSASFFAVNNTFVNSAGTGLMLTRTGDAGAMTVRLYNNIVWNNASNGVVVTGNSQPIELHAFHNTWNSIVAPLQTNQANSNLNPQLTAGFRLTEPGSPAINSGLMGITGGLPGVDLDGGPRVIGSTVDRGAYESAVDNSATLVVSNTNDSGAGSLRQAILNANASAGLTNRIVFQLPGCPGIIDLDSSLPEITDSLIVDGYSQAGSAPNTREFGNDAVYCVVLRNDDAELPSAFTVPASAANKRLELSGVAIGGFSAAVLLAGGANHYIYGNHFGPGLYSGNDDLAGSDWNVLVLGATHGVRVGGDDPYERNTIAGADEAGIQIAGSGENHTVHGNYIGTTRSGNASNAAVRNEIGLRLAGQGTNAMANLISGNGLGVEITGSDNVVVSNRIGVKALVICLPPCTPDIALGNGEGIVVAAGADDNTIWSNIVAHSLFSGVLLEPQTDNNRLTGNRIHGNGTLGIDLLTPAGPNPNDSDTLAPPGVANGGQNYPDLSFAGGGRRDGRLHGSLTSHGGDFHIEVFSSSTCDASGHGEGQVFHGTFPLAIPTPPFGQDGTTTFQVPLIATSGVGNLDGRAITTTATDLGNDTSEFSECVIYDCDQIFAHDFESASADTCPVP